MGLKIRKGDKVVVLAGRDRGKRGNVLECNMEKNTVLVEGVNLVTKHLKRRSEADAGGIKTIPQAMPISKVALICPACDRGVRFGVKVSDDKSKSRICKKCNQAF